MILFSARRLRSTDPLWITDADVAALLGVSRSTVWVWVDEGRIPEPHRVGASSINTRGGRRRSRATRWYRPDIELFADCRNMADFRRRKRQLG